MRDYDVMRDVLATVADFGGELRYGDFAAVQQRDEVPREIARLQSDGLLDGDLLFEGGMCMSGRVHGLTPEGREFLNLIANDGVWAIVRKTLKAANVDVSYPLLKEVCEEIVKRYVVSFIPDEIRCIR